MIFRARLYGVAAVQRRLEQLASVTRREVQEKALIAGGEVIAADARRRVHRRSGKLAGSIAVTLKPQNAAWSEIGISRGGVSVFVGPTWPDGWYGHFEEFGTVNAPAHPFMRPAIDGKRHEALRAIADRLRVEVRAATRG